MSKLPPPIPPPSGDVCQHCGANVNLKNEFCQLCGARLNKVRKKSFWDFVPLWIPALLALLFGIPGACSLSFSFPPSGTRGLNEIMRPSDFVTLRIIGCAGCALAAFFLFVVWRKRRDEP